MAALVHTTGAVHHFVRFRDTSTYWYLGTATVAPEVEADPSYLPVMNDLAGRSKPFNEIYDGETHAVYSTLSRFDYVIYQRLKDAYSHDSTLANRGVDGRVENGALLYSVGDFELVLQYDHYGTAAATANLPQGRRYMGSKLGGYKESTAGSRVMEVGLRFDCHRIFDATNRQFQLFSEDLSTLTLTTN